MRKVRSLVVVFVAMLVLGGSVFASSISSMTYIGVADFSNAGDATFSFVLKNVSGNGNVADKTIRWSTATAFNIGKNDSWVRANQYAVVAATVTKAGFNVYMYQTNLISTKYKPKNSSGTVLYRGNYVSSGTASVWVSSAASGLVRENIKNESANSGDYRCYIPIAYSLVAKSSPTITFDGTSRIWMMERDILRERGIILKLQVLVVLFLALTIMKTKIRSLLIGVVLMLKIIQHICIFLVILKISWVKMCMVRISYM